MFCQIKCSRPSQAVTATRQCVSLKCQYSAFRPQTKKASPLSRIQTCTEDKQDKDLFQPVKASARPSFNNATSTIGLPDLSGATIKKCSVCYWEIRDTFLQQVKLLSKTISSNPLPPLCGDINCASTINQCVCVCGCGGECSGSSFVSKDDAQSWG